ncbi:endonuclease/exonuclease/phosphatase family protein [Ilumatobacter nonamiensis]|uniref:endonuclease/exonuclease/phosphatase family protein n=1 Tax=Ilumatobacter nonamiensis TaxID=467093 RepID=UPI000348D2C0|nr:endonuclease/exonuclease/phosphatase family protein [Ilumatobacter nonamiensis]
MSEFRVATFNLENWDEMPAGVRPTLDERIALMRPQIDRLRADIVCFQEVNGQERAGEPRGLAALEELLVGTNLAGATLVTTRTQAGEAYDQRNLVVASQFPVVRARQIWNDFVAPPKYQRLTAEPPDADAVTIGIERPIQHVEIDIGEDGMQTRMLHVVNVHLKSKRPTNIPGQKVDNFTWRTASGWAEGFFLSSLKRMSQALEVRRLVDQILDDDPDAWIVVAGDFNADPDEVPVLAIRGDVESTGNGDLAGRVLVPIEQTIPETSRYTLFHHGRGEMIDHMLVTRTMLGGYRGSEIHNEILHDESIAFADDRKYPESDHAPVVASFST